MPLCFIIKKSFKAKGVTSLSIGSKQSKTEFWISVICLISFS